MWLLVVWGLYLSCHSEQRGTIVIQYLCCAVFGSGALDSK
ncbi:hypothetical protein F0Z19_3763 [Vibrio cyclitrophicus]|nr:hypothetical protein F0Z19_3762 [Vibrio cyclitrophicus]KAA8597915.1 hypothetical protein F0Z19_3763 [Vibrio cyclitrophicus]